MSAEDGGWGSWVDNTQASNATPDWATETSPYNNNFSFDPSTGVLTPVMGQSESGAPINPLGQYGPIAFTPGDVANSWPGGFFGGIDYLAATGQINQGDGGFWGSLGDWTTKNGWMIPLAMAGAMGGAIYGGAAAGSAAGGAGGLGTGMVDAAGNIIGGGAQGAAYGAGAAMGPTYAELGYTGLPEGAAGPTYGEMGYTGLNQQTAIDAANAASASQGTSFTDALKTANQIKQGVNTASSLAKLLSPTSSLGAGSALSNAAQKLATGQTGVGSAIPALIRGNQNPFLQTAQQPIRSSSPDLAQLAQLLKQG